MPAQAVTGAITLCQINAPADTAVDILRAWVSFNSIVSTAIEVGIKRISTGGTGTGITASPHLPNNAAFGGSVTIFHTAEGTFTDYFYREYTNYLNGWLHLPVPEERIRIAPSGRLALYLPTAPGASITISAGIIFGEL